MAASTSKAAQTFGLCLTHNRLRVNNVKKVSDFYVERFGMKRLSSVDGDEQVTQFLAFKGTENETKSSEVTMFELMASKITDGKGTAKNIGGQNTVYWKIGVNMPDVDLAAKKLRHGNIEVSEPSQFRDIGYLCHLSDPENFTIELLQFYFQDRKKPYKALPILPLGQQPIFGMITLRVKDIETSLKFYRDTLGMKLLCKEDVSIYGFYLYFLAFTDDEPPNSDVNAEENREWTYQRSCTVIELQAPIMPPKDLGFKPLDKGDYGFMGLGMGTTDIEGLRRYIEENHNKDVTSIEEESTFHSKAFSTTDPDGIPIRFLQL